MRMGDVGYEVTRLGLRVTGMVVSAPVVGGFVALGAAVLLGRTIREAARWTRGQVLRSGAHPAEQGEEGSKAA